MTGEQVHKCSCHNWCGTMQHQRQARQGPGQQKLNEFAANYTQRILVITGMVVEIKQLEHEEYQ